MMIRLINIRFFLFGVLWGMPGLVGCVGEEIACPTERVPVHATPVTITVSIPGQRIPSGSRSIADDGGEAVVKTIDVLVFRSGGAGNPEMLADHASGRIASQSSSPDDEYEVRFTADLAEEPAATTIVILANVPASTVAAATARSAKPDVLESLVHTSANDSGTPDGWKWKAVSPSEYTPIPMYGERPVSGIASGMQIGNVALTRMLARIDVENNAPGFTLTGIYVVNFHTSGYIAPAWSTGGVLSGSLPDTPMIPGTSTPKTGESNAMYYAVPGTALSGGIYLYEAPATSDDPERIDDICLIIKGKRTGDGDDTFYRIDFTGGASGFDPPTTGYMAVYRNHRYRFDISEVSGAGYGLFDDALRSRGLTNNLKTHLHVVDQSGIHYLVFNGQYCLGAGTKTFGVLPVGYSGYELEIFSNAGTPTAASSDNWITVGVPQPAADGKYTLTFSVGANTGSAARTGHIDLRAGRLSLTVNVHQEPIINAVP